MGKQSMRELCEKICCSHVTKECMYRECKKCEKKQIEFECGKAGVGIHKEKQARGKRNCETKWREKDIQCASYCERKGVLYLRESAG